MKSGRLTKILFGLYLLFLLWIVLLKASFSLGDIRALVSERSVNWIPFTYAKEVGTHRSEVLRNVLIFLPFGLYLRMLGVRWGRAILYGFLLSLGCEVTQVLCSIGAGDVTDLLTNTAGTALGVLGYLIFRGIFRERTNRFLNTLALILTIWLAVLLLLLIIAN